MFSIKRVSYLKKSNRKEKAAILSVISNTVLILLKIFAGIISGSVSIISEAIHSAIDLIASIISYFSVKYSSKPADVEHPYGHGKIENISAAFEGLLIFVAAIFIIKEAFEKILHPSDIEETTIAITVMVFAAIVNIFVSKRLYKVAKEEDSMALEADALHLKTDVYTSLGVGLGILLIAITEINILDPIIAIIVALMIIREAWDLCKKAYSTLLDAKLNDEEEEIILSTIAKYSDKYIDIHCLRTRKSGNIKYIDFHMTVEAEATVKQSHDLCDEIEEELESVLKNTNINIHLEPCETKEAKQY